MKRLRFLAALVLAGAAVMLVGCNTNSGSSPDYVGVWSTPLTQGTLTVTFTATTVHFFFDFTAGETETTDAAISSVNDTAKTFIFTVSTDSHTAGVVSPFFTNGEVSYTLYSVVGTTMTLKTDPISYPTDLIGAQSLTKQ